MLFTFTIVATFFHVVLSRKLTESSLFHFSGSNNVKFIKNREYVDYRLEIRKTRFLPFYFV